MRIERRSPLEAASLCARPPPLCAASSLGLKRSAFPLDAARRALINTQQLTSAHFFLPDAAAAAAACFALASTSAFLSARDCCSAFLSNDGCAAHARVSGTITVEARLAPPPPA